MKKMVMTAVILVVTGFMYGKDKEEKDSVARYSRSKRHKRHRDRRKTNSMEKDVLSNVINSFVKSKKKVRAQKSNKPEIAKIDTINFYGEIHYAKNKNGHLLRQSNSEESKDDFILRLSVSYDVSKLITRSQ